MSKFYEHNQNTMAQEAARLDAEERKQGVANDDLAHRAIIHLLDIVEHGLPTCYDSFETFLIDFYPDLH